MRLVGQEAFLKPYQRRFAEYSVPGFGRVRLQSISERERCENEASMTDDVGRFDKRRATEAKARLIVLCVVNEEGHRILGDHHVKQLPDTLDSGVANHLYELCVKHCHIDPLVEEELEKNLSGSPETDAGDSPSSLPTDSECSTLTSCSVR